jgi:restriction system protein
LNLHGLEVDLKVTSLRQPQSFCPFRDATQKIYGLGYHLLIFVYEKQDIATEKVAMLKILHTVFIKEHTGDYQTTFGLRRILAQSGNRDDIEAFLLERNLPLDDIGRQRLAELILAQPPRLGYLTISNALQWRLQYSRAIELANNPEFQGLESLL